MTKSLRNLDDFLPPRAASNRWHVKTFIFSNYLNAVEAAAEMKTEGSSSAITWTLFRQLLKLKRFTCSVHMLTIQHILTKLIIRIKLCDKLVQWNQRQSAVQWSKCFKFVWQFCLLMILMILYYSIWMSNCIKHQSHDIKLWSWKLSHTANSSTGILWSDPEELALNLKANWAAGESIFKHNCVPAIIIIWWYMMRPTVWNRRMRFHIFQSIY